MRELVHGKWHRTSLQMSIIRVKRCFVDFHRATLYQPDAYIVLLHFDCAALHVQHETESFQVSLGMRHHFSGCRRVTMQSTNLFQFPVSSLDFLYSGKNFLSCCVITYCACVHFCVYHYIVKIMLGISRFPDAFSEYIANMQIFCARMPLNPPMQQMCNSEN